MKEKEGEKRRYGGETIPNKVPKGEKKTDENMSRDGPVRKPQGIQSTWSFKKGR